MMISTPESINNILDIGWEIRKLYPAEALRIAQVAYLESLESDYPVGISGAFVTQAVALSHMNYISEAIENLDKALIQLSTVPDNRWHFLAYTTIGNIYVKLGHYEQAFENLMSALTIAEALNDRKDIIQAKGNLGTFAFSRGEYDKAVVYFQDLLASAETKIPTETKFTIYLNLSATYYYLGEYNNAIQMAQYALNIADTDEKILTAHGNLGVAYVEVGQHKQAKYHLEKSLTLVRDLSVEPNRTLCICLIDLATYHIKVDEAEQAISYLLEALSLAESVSYAREVKDCHQHLYKIYRGQGNLERALHHHEQLYEMNETMFNERTEKRIQNLEILHKVETLHQVNEHQKQEYDILMQMRDDLLSNVSHDLKTPLSVVKTNIYLARKTALEKTESHLRYLERIEKQVGYMTNLIKDVLDAAQFDRSIGLDFQHIDISDLIKDVYTSYQPQATAKHITLTYQQGKKIYLWADSQAIHRVLVNLVSNAIKYTDLYGSVEVLYEQLDSGQTRIQVKDSGIGIPEAELPQIFDRFYRVTTHTHLSEGTGLGLSIVKSIIKNHGGQIEVASQVNQGTTITFYLPSAPIIQ